MCSSIKSLMKKNNYQQFNQIIKGVGVITLSFFFVFLSVSLIAKAGNLTPDGTPVGTMHSLSEIAGTGFVQATHSLKAVYDKINGLVTDLWNKPTADLTDTDRVGGFVVERLDQTISSRAAASTALSSANWTDARAGYLDAIVGSYSNTDSANLEGNTLERLAWLIQNLSGNYTYGSNTAAEVLTTAGGSYDTTNLIASNVRVGVGFDNGLTGTYGNDSWTYGSDDASKVLTTADASGSYNATSLSVGTVKKDTSFGVSLTGDYPSSTYPLPGDTGVTNATAAEVKNDFESWDKDGSIIAGTLIPSSGTATVSDVVIGKTFFGASQNNWTLQTGTFDPWTSQKYVRWEDNRFEDGATGAPFDEYTGEESTWAQSASGGTAASVTDNGTTITLASNIVYQNERTGRYWTDRADTNIDNEFRYDAVGQCNFTDTGDANEYCDNQDPDNDYAEDDDVSANEFCLNLCLDADNADSDDNGLTGTECDWHLPSQKELIQAYIDGACNNLINYASINGNFWSSTGKSSTPGIGFHVNLANGQTTTPTKDTDRSVRCVRP